MENPLYTTKEEAYAAPGEIYQHYKGGVYRVLQRGVKNTETGELGVLYEHLWPHEHTVYWRPEGIFFSRTSDGSERFLLVKKA